jgi:hypothetical protein
VNQERKATAFGLVEPKTWQSADRVGHELRDPFDADPGRLWDSLDLKTRQEIFDWREAVALHSGRLLDHLPNEASKLILTAATNDVLTLVTHVNQLDGRSAAHSARALFEHLVNFLDVQSTVDAAERYEAHRHVTEEQISRRRWYLQYLDKKARKRESGRLKGLANRSKQPLAQAIAQYGPRFRLGWAAGTLRDRADAHDLAEDYDGYRILSGVIHGSSGAMAGIVKTIRGRVVHRIGPDLDLAASAYAEGLMNYYQLAKALVAATNLPEADELYGRTGNLILALPTVRETLRRIDAKMWPAAPAPATFAVVALYKSGRQRWFIHDLREETLTLAEPPDDPPDLSIPLADLEYYDPEQFGGRPMSTVFPHISLVPHPNTTRVPAASILVPYGHPARLPKLVKRPR